MVYKIKIFHFKSAKRGVGDEIEKKKKYFICFNLILHFVWFLQQQILFKLHSILAINFKSSSFRIVLV